MLYYLAELLSRNGVWTQGGFIGVDGCSSELLLLDMEDRKLDCSRHVDFTDVALQTRFTARLDPQR